jgi:hypothetical protein
MVARIADDKCFVHEHCEISISVMQNTFNFLLYLRLRSGSFRSVPGYSKITSPPIPLSNVYTNRLHLPCYIIEPGIG